MIETLSDCGYARMRVCGGYAYTHTGKQRMQKGGSWGEGRNSIHLPSKKLTTHGIRMKSNTDSHANAITPGLCGNECQSGAP
jgi:hypothetical protein